MAQATQPVILAAIAKILDHSRIALKEASEVQCVGMREPIPINAIYQQAHLVDGRGHDADLLALIRSGEDAIILAEPGRGKTTLVRWAYMQRDETLFPLLFTLRHEDAVADLALLIREPRSAVVKSLPKSHIALLIDGYDETSEKKRRRVSNALMTFAGLNLGSFCLTCRTYFINNRSYWIRPHGRF